MKEESFGSYLRFLRLSKHPPVTQEQLAQSVGRSKMCISQFECGKNAAPQGELLEKIIIALEMSKNEEVKMRFLAAKERRSLPSDIENYFFENSKIYELIRMLMLSGVKYSDWSHLIDSLEESCDEKNTRTD